MLVLKERLTGKSNPQAEEVAPSHRSEDFILSCLHADAVFSSPDYEGFGDIDIMINSSRANWTWRLSLSLSLYVLACVAVAAIFVASRPVVNLPNIRIGAFAFPAVAKVNEAAQSFGIVFFDDESIESVIYTLELCEAERNECRILTRQQIQPELNGFWFGRVSQFSIPQAGEYIVNWRVYFDMGLDSPWQLDVYTQEVLVQHGA